MSDVIIPEGFEVKVSAGGTILLLMRTGYTRETDAVYAAVLASKPDAIRELVRRFEALPEKKRHE